MGDGISNGFCWNDWRETDEEKLKKITLPTPESEQTLLSMI